MAAAPSTLATIWSALGGAPEWLGQMSIQGHGALPSAFPVTDLAAGSVGAAALAVAALIGTRNGVKPTATVDRRLASFWFGSSIRPLGWALPPVWDDLAGDYRTADGWLRIHTHVPRHRAVVLGVLGVQAGRDQVAAAIATWSADALEAAIVEQGGAAAAMRSMAAWAAHPQGQAVAAEPLLHREPGSPAAAPAWRLPRERPLQGIRVLDLTRVLAGPVATRFLAGFGAEVLRIDPPDWDEPSLAPDITLGKRCARLDLRQPDGRGTLDTLLRQADVLVHGYRPGALPGLGLDAARRQALRPGLVDVCLDAYGWTGPWAGRRGFDSLVQMSSGIADAGMTRLGRDRPTPLPVQALDHATGYLLAAAVLRGLADRLTTGAGTVARASLARTAALLAGMTPGAEEPLTPEGADDLTGSIEPTSWGPARRVLPPCRIEGAPMRWDRAAAALGSAAACW